MSLRDLPPDQAINTSRWRRLRYVPLTALVAIAAIMIPVGYVVSHRAVPPAPVATSTAPAVAQRLPQSCRPAMAAPSQEPWQGSLAAASEATWQSHSADLQNPYVLGEDGWADWGDVQANNFSQVLGRRFLTADEVQRWHSYFAKLDAGLTAEGIPLYIVIAPSKFSVYTNEIPAWAKPIRGSGPFDQLLAASPDLPIVDLRPTLIAESAKTQVYSRLNSHWSDYGAYVAWNAITDCIKASSTGFEGLNAIPISGTTTTEFNEFANYGLTSSAPDWTVPTFVTPLSQVSLSANGAPAKLVDGLRRTSFGDLPATTDLSSAQVDKSLLLVSDSFSVMMSPYVQQAFAHTQQLRHNFDGDPSTQPDVLTLARTLKPSVVIIEVAQRHLNFPPVSP